MFTLRDDEADTRMADLRKRFLERRYPLILVSVPPETEEERRRILRVCAAMGGTLVIRTPAETTTYTEHGVVVSVPTIAVTV